MDTNGTTVVMHRVVVDINISESRINRHMPVGCSHFELEDAIGELEYMQSKYPDLMLYISTLSIDI